MHKHFLILSYTSQLKCLPANAHTPLSVHACLGWCDIPLTNVSYLMRTCNVRFLKGLANTTFHWFTSLSLRSQDLAEGACVGRRRCCSTDAYTLMIMHAAYAHSPLVMHACHWWWCILLSGKFFHISTNNVIFVKTLVEACNWAISLSRCMNARTEFTQLMCTCHVWFVQPLLILYVMSLGQSANARTDVDELMHINMDDVCWPWVLLPPIGQCLLADAHMQKWMLPGQCA